MELNFFPSKLTFVDIYWSVDDSFIKTSDTLLSVCHDIVGGTRLLQYEEVVHPVFFITHGDESGYTWELSNTMREA